MNTGLILNLNCEALENYYYEKIIKHQEHNKRVVEDWIVREWKTVKAKLPTSQKQL
jgi:ribosomal protein S17E